MSSNGTARAFATLLVLAAIATAGCVGDKPGASQSSVVATPFPKVATPTATPTDAASPSPAASPTATDPLPTVPTAPAGTWSAVRWTALPASSAFTGAGATEGARFQVFGWSHGYVAFTMLPGAAATDGQITSGDLPAPDLVASYSTDGVHWTIGQRLDRKAAGSMGLMAFRSVVEGPMGLLAVGLGGACASEFVDSLWTSPDGMTWQPVDMGKVFGANHPSIASVSGGGAGFTAVAYNGGGAWTSADGRAWKSVAIGADPFSNAKVDHGTAVAGGFALAGTTGTRDCGVTTYPDGNTPAPVYRTALAWFSTDGVRWTNVALPGAVSTSKFQRVWTAPLGNRGALIVDDIVNDSSSGDTARYAWQSADGRTWSKIDLPKDIREAEMSGTGHVVIVSGTGTGDAAGKLKLRTIDSSFAVITIAQSGDLPSFPAQVMMPYGIAAAGPTGIVVTDGSNLWFGQPATR